MNISVNGEKRRFEEGLSLKGLLEALDIRPQGIAIELNREIVPRGSYAETLLKEGDTVEVVRMTGGG